MKIWGYEILTCKICGDAIQTNAPHIRITDNHTGDIYHVCAECAIAIENYEKEVRDNGNTRVDIR